MRIVTFRMALAFLVLSLVASIVPLLPLLVILPRPEDSASTLDQEEGLSEEDGGSDKRPGSLEQLMAKRPVAPPLGKAMTCIDDLEGDVEGVGTEKPDYIAALQTDIRRLCASYGEGLRLDMELDEPIDPLASKPIGTFVSFDLSHASSATFITFNVALVGADLQVDSIPKLDESCETKAFWAHPALLLDLTTACLGSHTSFVLGARSRHQSHSGGFSTDAVQGLTVVKT